MRLVRTLVFVLLSLNALAQKPAGLSPRTQIYLRELEEHPAALPKNYVYRQVGGSVYVAAFLQVTKEFRSSSLQNIGVLPGTRAGSILTVSIPAKKVATVAGITGVLYLQLDEPVHPNLDVVRSLTRVDTVHDGLGGLSQPYHGDGVIVGIIDAGFDYRHPSLFDSTGTRYRVKKVWEQTSTGTPPTGYGYGHEMTDSSTMWSKGYDMFFSHGTHVAGIAAGSGFGSPNNRLYKGMADAADLVFVSITPPDTDWTSTGMTSIVDGMNYIYNYAALAGKPAIVNLSWGCTIGAHDGRSLFSQACDNLTGPGRIFAISAGNNGGNNVHLKKTFSATDTLLKSFVNFSTALSVKQTWVDIWGDSAKNFCVQLLLYNGSTVADSTGYICLDNQLHSVQQIGSNYDTFFARVVTASQEMNGKPRIFIELKNQRPESVMIRVKAQDGTVNLWTGFVQNTTGYYGSFAANGVAGAVNGDYAMTVGDMASTRSALAVGAYVSKTAYQNANGQNITVTFASANGGLASFSSRGPSADGRIKPDITAPGMVIASGINSYDPEYAGGAQSSVVYNWNDPGNGRTYSYAMLMGTSMSSPVAAGIVALMLQANPTLTPQLVRDALAQTALQDSKTGAIPAGGNNNWGAGKINALAAVKRAMTITGIPETPMQNADFDIFPNPASHQTTVYYPGSSHSETLLTVTDMAGRIVHQSSLSGRPENFRLTLNIEGWTKGMYLLSLRRTNLPTLTKKLLIN